METFKAYLKKIKQKLSHVLRLLITIQTIYTQPITVGIDTGSKPIEVSASTSKKELITEDN